MGDRVLVIDDNVTYLESLIRTLQSEGIEASGQSDPTKALETFMSDPVDVVVVDYLFDAHPEITGLDVIARIREAKPFIKTVLISARINHQTLEESALADELKGRALCDYYLPKPGTREQLVQTVREALESIAEKSTDWKAIAEDYVAAGKVDAEEVRKLNERLKANILPLEEELMDEDP